MKLFKKLLPIISAASVATIVTPIVTSCAGDESGWLKANYDLDPEAEGFIKCTNLPEAEENLTTKEYAWAIYNNKQIVYDDYRYWLTTLDRIVFDLPYALYLILPVYLPISMVYSDVTTLRGKMSNLSIDPSLYTISYDLEIKLNVELGIEVPLLREVGIDPSIVFNIKSNFSVHYDKCPFFVGPDYMTILLHEYIPDLVDPNGAAFILNFSRMLNDPVWYQTLNFGLQVQAFNGDIDLGLVANTNKSLTLNAWKLSALEGLDYVLMIIGQIFGGWSSYYYSDMEWPEIWGAN